MPENFVGKPRHKWVSDNKILSDHAEFLAGYLPRTTFARPGTEIVCGVSGGADSLALLALGAASGCSVTAVHVDHGQRAGSEADAEVVRRAADASGSQFRSERVQVLPGPNLEARMRAARYSVLGSDSCTGHTADDQAETMLINLARGTGIAGLGAMQPGPRRPLLELRRTDTEHICSLLGWQPLHDPSNDDPAFVRNRMRHELVPLLSDIAQRDIVPLLCRTSAHARDTAEALDELAVAIDPTDALALRSAHTAVATVALQRWIRSSTGAEHPIDSAAIERILAVVDGRAVAAEVTGGFRVSRTGQRLRIA